MVKLRRKIENLDTELYKFEKGEEKQFYNVGYFDKKREEIHLSFQM